ncbi:MAG: phosphate ABC transporter permease subunit PstC [Oscillospiraceae bacterium]
MKRDILFSTLLKALTALTVALLAFILYFIVRESLPLFREVPLTEFLFGTVWRPVSYSGAPTYGILPILAATVAVSALAVLLAAVCGIGASLYLSCIASRRARRLLYPFLDLLAGIPSVVYGFLGLTVLVRGFQNWGRSSGECILAAGILLAVMLLPFLISACSETMLQMRERYLPVSGALGVDRWYALTHLLLPLSARGILLSLVLAIGRAMGETMAVMMVIGNAAIFPTLLGKGETIASLIALEMGTVEVGSTHYHALYAMGLVLLLLLLLINAGIAAIRSRLLRGERL